MKFVLLLLVLGAFAEDYDKWARRRMSEMEDTEEVEYYLYDENPVGKCVDGPMGDDKADMIYQCTDDGIMANVYALEGCEGDMVESFELTNDPNDEEQDGYGYCVDFDAEGPGVKHAVVNIKMKQELPRTFIEECPPDVYNEKKNGCVMMHDMEDGKGETRLVVMPRTKIGLAYAKFRKVKMQELEQKMRDGDMDEVELADTLRQLDELKELSLRGEVNDVKESEVGGVVSEVLGAFKQVGTDTKKVMNGLKDKFSFGGVGKMSEVTTIASKIYNEAQRFITKLKNKIISTVQKFMCKKVVRYICDHASSIACWVARSAASHLFCDAKNQDDHMKHADDMIRTIVRGFINDIKQSANKMRQIYKDYIVPLIDAAAAAWQGGAIGVNVELSFLLWDFTVNPLTIAVDRWRNLSFLSGVGYERAYGFKVELAIDYSMTVYGVLDDVGQMAGHAQAYTLSFECGEGVQVGVEFSMEMYCGSFVTANIPYIEYNLAAFAYCAMDSIGLVDIPGCKCSPAGRPDAFSSKVEQNDMCHLMGGSVTIEYGAGFQFGKVAGFCDANIALGYGWAHEWWTNKDDSKSKPTGIESQCWGSSDYGGVQRFNLSGRSRDACIKSCERSFNKDKKCVAAEYDRNKKKCYGVRMCPKLVFKRGSTIYQTMAMKKHSGDRLDDYCWRSLQCGKQTCKYGTTCKGGKCVDWTVGGLGEEVSVGSFTHNEIDESGRWNYFVGGVLCTGFVGLLIYGRNLMYKKSAETYGLLENDEL